MVDKLEQVGAGAVDAVMLHDGVGNIIDGNEAAWTTTGYTRQEYLELNMRQLDIDLANVPQEKLGQNWAKMKLGSPLRLSSRHRRKNGSEFPTGISVAVFEKDGQRLFVAACRDLTNRHELEEERQQMYESPEVLVSERTEELIASDGRFRDEIGERERAEIALAEAKRAAEAASAAKSQFLASMSHELRTPLNAVIGYTEMLQEETEELGQTESIPYLGKIRDAGKHLLEIINDILDLSKVEAGKMEVHLDDADLPSLLAEIGNTILPLAKKNENQLNISAGERLGVLRTDVTRLQIRGPRRS